MSITDMPAPGGPATEGQAPNDGKGQEPEPEQSKTFDAAYVAKLRAEAAASRKRAAELEAAEAQRQAETKAADELRLAEQQKWQELAAKRADELTATTAKATTLEAQVAKLTDALSGYLAKEREGVPEHIGALLDKLDIADQLTYISANKEAWQRRPDGIPPSPKPGEAPALSEQERRQRAYQPRL